MIASPPWASLLLIGPTGSGKTPLGDELERRGLDGRRCAHFDFGRTLRSVAADGGGAFGLTAKEEEAVRNSLDSGALFEDKDLPMIRKILAGFAQSRGLGPGDLLVLNGLPRHRGQAEALEGTLAMERVVSLEAEAKTIQERIRRDTGGDRSGRTDDDLDSVTKRLEIYRSRTAPLLGYYRDRGVPVTAIRVTAAMTAGEMCDELGRDVHDGF
ncbi:MAG TPA: nucleoside monophosphate kinase [Candidatus Bathyarchaeia archaeon]|nr:nucleoside monophosphate kinase [Candidatus Bathyarchaeia archaeon]